MHRMPIGVSCWWRSTKAYKEECERIKNDTNNLPSITCLTPSLKVVRELERLAVESKSLTGVRNDLQKYRAGDFWIPTGVKSKEEMDIPDLNTIMLVGFSGSGKSSLVNLMYSVLGESGVRTFAQTATGSAYNCHTMYLEEHNVLRSKDSGFCIYDSRGFDYDKVGEALQEVSNWMRNGVHHNKLCLTSKYSDKLRKEDKRASKFIHRKVNCVMVVIDIARIYKALQAGDPEPLEAIRKLYGSPCLKKCNENPMLIFTHGDMLTAEERIEGRLKICEALGVLETKGVYDIVCLTEYGFLTEEFDPVTAYALAESVSRALFLSDKGHSHKTFWNL